MRILARSEGKALAKCSYASAHAFIKFGLSILKKVEHIK